MTAIITLQNLVQLGALVRFHRKKAGLSRVNLATVAGVGKTAVFDIEQGKPTIQLATLLKVLNALNITTILDSPLMDLFKGNQDA